MLKTFQGRGANTVGEVVIRCPNTGQEVSTGIETDKESFDRLSDVLSHTHCPVCGLEHSWWKREARLDEKDGRDTRNS